MSPYVFAPDVTLQKAIISNRTSTTIQPLMSSDAVFWAPKCSEMRFMNCRTSVYWDAFDFKIALFLLTFALILMHLHNDTFVTRLCSFLIKNVLVHIGIPCFKINSLIMYKHKQLSLKSHIRDTGGGGQMTGARWPGGMYRPKACSCVVATLCRRWQCKRCTSIISLVLCNVSLSL